MQLRVNLGLKSLVMQKKINLRIKLKNFKKIIAPIKLKDYPLTNQQ